MQQTSLPNNEYFQFSKIDGDAQSLTHGQGLYKASGKSAKRASSCCVPGAGARGCQPSIEKTEAEMRFLRSIRGVKKLWRAFACIHARQSRVPVEVAGRRERSCSCDGGCRETESHLAAPFRYNGTLAPINRLPLLLSLPRALPSLFPASFSSFSARLVLFCIPQSVRPRKCRVKQQKMANPL